MTMQCKRTVFNRIFYNSENNMSETPCVTVRWDVENLKYLPSTHSLLDCEVLKSPKFYVEAMDRSEWELSIFPNGKEVKIFLHNIHLNRNRCMWIAYKISLLSSDDSVLWTGNKKNMRINDGNSYQIDTFPSFQKNFDCQEDKYLNQSGLNIRCQIWKVKKISTHPVLYFMRTHIELNSLFYHWKVENFSLLETNGRRKSWEIRIGEDRPIFYVDLSLEGLSCNQANVILAIEQVNQNISELFLTCQISVLSASGNILKQSVVEPMFLVPGEDSWTIPHFISKNEVAAKFLEDDALNLLFNLSFASGDKYSKLEYVTRMPSWVHCNVPRNLSQGSNIAGQQVLLKDKPGPSREGAKKKSVAFLQDDLLALYKHETMTDFELMAGDKSFSVHKVLLAARSPVFRDMFSRDKTDGDYNFFILTDVDEDTLQKMLLFIYTDNIEISEWSTASKLYLAADKFKILPLKKKCSVYLSNNLSDRNVCKILSLADQHKDEVLKSSVLNFLVNNDNEIIPSEKWKAFIEINPTLANPAFFL